MGANSLGFKRLLWFDLIATAYLDVLRVLPTERKEVKLVYYDCREVTFEDVGLSARMTEAILSEARRLGIGGGLDNLSDLLGLLLQQGFRMSLCVDSRQAQEPGVSGFLQALRRIGRGNLKILEREVEGGSMHKKALQTPVAVLKGSGNLTPSATTRNEEITDHVFYGAPSYEGLKASIEDTFQGSRPWNP